MENKKNSPATQQPMQQQVMAHHVHLNSERMYPSNPHLHLHNHKSIPFSELITSPIQPQLHPNGIMHQLLMQNPSSYQTNLQSISSSSDARSPLLENRHDIYGTHNHEYPRHYGANESYTPQSPQPKLEPRLEVQNSEHSNHQDLMQAMPKGYNAEVYQDYLKRNPPKDTNQIYQNHQALYKPAVSQYTNKPYLPYTNRIQPPTQSNTELLRRQYNEIQQMKLQQQLHYQNRAQMQQQQTFAERQLLLQQMHGIQPPPNLQNSIYSDESFRESDQYLSKQIDYNETERYGGNQIEKKEPDRRGAKHNEYKDSDRLKLNDFRQSDWNVGNQSDYREPARQRSKQSPPEDRYQIQSPSSDNQSPQNKQNVGVASPVKSGESNSPSVKSPSLESRRSSGGAQALRSPVAQRLPSAPVTMSGLLYKQGSDGLKVWRKRWFVLSEYCLFYYKNQDEEKLLGSVLLPSYRVSACTAEDKVLRKYAFKLEHANMRTYVLAAPDQDQMIKWVKALNMAAVMEGLSSDQPQRQTERAAVSAEIEEDTDEPPGPTYANAPPKPRRSNDGYNSPSPDMYDPNYDLLQKPASHYSQGTSTRHAENTNHMSPNMDNVYSRSPQSPQLYSGHYGSKRPYDSHALSLPLTNTASDRLENNAPHLQNTATPQNNTQSPYFDNRTRSQQQQRPDTKTNDNKMHDQIYDHSSQKLSFREERMSQNDATPRESDIINRNYKQEMYDRTTKPAQNEPIDISQNSNFDPNIYSRDNQNEQVIVRQNRGANQSAGNERLSIERRTPDAYGRSTVMSGYGRAKGSDYEDVYTAYAGVNEYGPSYANPTSPPGSGESKQQTKQYQGSEYPASQNQNQSFSGPSVLRRKKMQSNNIQQQQVQRPHSADFLEYESKNEMLNATLPARAVCEPARQPQRPKSSLDINSYYDPSSDRYYSEESYAEKMRQSAQHLIQGSTKNMQIPLAMYSSGLAEKQLNSPYGSTQNNNYEANVNKTAKDNVSYNSKYGEVESLNSNWTLKEKDLQKEYLNRSGSVLSDGSNVVERPRDGIRHDPSMSDGFMRSASARLPSTNNEKEGEKKVQQREESMKRLLEWKQRMLQSPLTRKSTPATISLARSLNQSRQSNRSADHYKTKATAYTNATYNSYSSDDEASMIMSAVNLESNTSKSINQQNLAKKAFLGSNTSIGRNSRDNNIPVRAVSPRIRWVEDKTPTDAYGSQKMSSSQQNLSTLTAEDSWATARTPSRVSQQPIRAVSPRVRRHTDNDERQTEPLTQSHSNLTQLFPEPDLAQLSGDNLTAGQLLGRTHEELVLLLIQLRRRHAATHQAMEQCWGQINSIKDCMGSVTGLERQESLQRLEQLKVQLMELEHQYEKSKPLVHLVDNMVKLGSLYNRPGSTVERLERNQRLRQKILDERASEQCRWLESAGGGRAAEAETARARVAELWALERELADEAAALHGLRADKDAIETLLTGVRSKFSLRPTAPRAQQALEADLARVHSMLAHNSKKLEQTVADNARLERELFALRRALHTQRAAHASSAGSTTALLEDEVARVQQLVSALQRQRQELSRAVRHLTQQSKTMQTTNHVAASNNAGKVKVRHNQTAWQETNLDTGHTIDHGVDYEYDEDILPPGHYEPNMSHYESSTTLYDQNPRHYEPATGHYESAPGHYEPATGHYEQTAAHYDNGGGQYDSGGSIGMQPLYVDTHGESELMSPLTSEDIQNGGIGNLSNIEKQEIKTVRIVKRESERRQRDRDRSLQPTSDWSATNITANLDHLLEEEFSNNSYGSRSSSLPRPQYNRYDEYYAKTQNPPPNYLRLNNTAEMTSSMELSPKYPSSPSLSNYDYSRDISSLSSYNRSYDYSGHDRGLSLSTQYLNSPTDSNRTLTNDPISKTSSIGSLTRSHVELSPIFKSEAAKQIITEMSSDGKNGSLHRRQVPKEKRRHYTAPHHLSAKVLNEMPKDYMYNHHDQKMGRSLDDTDMERALRAPPDVVRSAIAPQRYAENTIDQLLAAPQKILIPERYVPEKPPELSPEEQQKRMEKVESIKKMLSGSTSADPSKSPDGEDKRQREHLLQMNQILAKQVMEMSKIVAGTNSDGQGPSAAHK